MESVSYYTQCIVIMHSELFPWLILRCHATKPSKSIETYYSPNLNICSIRVFTWHLVEAYKITWHWNNDTSFRSFYLCEVFLLGYHYFFCLFYTFYTTASRDEFYQYYNYLVFQFVLFDTVRGRMYNKNQLLYIMLYARYRNKPTVT